MCNVDSIRLWYFFPPNSALLAFAVKEERKGKKGRERKEGLERQKSRKGRKQHQHTLKRRQEAAAQQDRSRITRIIARINIIFELQDHREPWTDAGAFATNRSAARGPPPLQRPSSSTARSLWTAAP